MILYLDSSAIVKQYIEETGAAEMRRVVALAEVSGTSVIARAEVIATFQKTIRVGILRREEAERLRISFNRGWPNLARIRITERLIDHASDLAWKYGLRGYDAVHLGSAAAWQQALGLRVTIASFDRALWTAAREIELEVFPEDLPALLSAGKHR